MIEWVSDIDLFKELLDVDYTQIETPLVINNVLMTDYRYQKMNHLILHQMNVKGKEENIEAFKLLLDHRYQPLTFSFDNLTEVESFWMARFIQLLLYKDYQITATTVTYVNQIFTPYHDKNYIYVDNLITLNLFKLVGFIPLLDLYHDQVDLNVATSDLIYTLDLSLFDYEVIHDIPAIKINSRQHDQIIATMTEFGFDLLSPLVTNVTSLLQNTFSMTNVDVDQLIKFDFKVIPSIKTDRVYLQHESLDKEWVINDQPLITIAGEWIWQFNNNFDTRVYLTYAANLITNAKVNEDLSVTIPYTKNIEGIKDKMNKILNSKLPMYQIADHGDFMVDDKWIKIKKALPN